MASNLHSPMPSLPFCPSCNDTESEDDKDHEPSSQSEYSPSDSRGSPTSLGSGSNTDDDQAGAEEPKLSLYSFLDAPAEEVERTKTLLLHKSIVSRNIHIKKSRHTLNVDQYAIRMSIKAFLVELTLLSYCFNRRKCHFIKCGCV
jgi:hypothetical protein